MLGPDVKPQLEPEKTSRRGFLGKVLIALGLGTAAGVGIKSCEESGSKPPVLTKPLPTLTTGERKVKEEIRKADDDPGFKNWLRTNRPDEFAERYPITETK